MQNSKTIHRIRSEELSGHKVIISHARNKVVVAAVVEHLGKYLLLNNQISQYATF